MQLKCRCGSYFEVYEIWDNGHSSKIKCDACGDAIQIEELELEYQWKDLKVFPKKGYCFKCSNKRLQPIEILENIPFETSTTGPDRYELIWDKGRCKYQRCIKCGYIFKYYKWDIFKEIGNEQEILIKYKNNEIDIREKIKQRNKTIKKLSKLLGKKRRDSN